MVARGGMWIAGVVTPNLVLNGGRVGADREAQAHQDSHPGLLNFLMQMALEVLT